MASARAANSSRQKLAKRACDPCKVRKIKCSEVAPCNGCISAGIECTFVKAQSIRGPRSLRTRTIDKINRAQRGQEASPRDASSSPPGDSATETLVDLLSIYATRLYPIWPIVEIEQLSHELKAEPRDQKAHHLAEAVALATVAQLKLTTSASVATVQKVEQDQRLNSDDIFDSLRVSFFLHIYHENQTAGGVTSLLYLREAITKAQILGIDRESFFAPLEESEQQIYRRALWLLFVTERGVAMLHKLPVVLKPNTMFPWFGRANDHFHVLPAFLKLVHLFWIFDQSAIFELLRNSDSDVSSMESLARSCLGSLQKKLRESAVDDISANNVQRADILVTRQWMKAVLWRAALRFGIVVPDNHPVDIADELLRLASQLPKTALESQGPTLEFKTFEIATAVIDALASNSPSGRMDHPHKVLLGLQRILSSSRGGNKALLSLLNSRMATVAPDMRLLSQPATVAEPCDAISTNDLLLPEAIDWSMLTQTMGIMPPYLDQPNYHSIEQQMAQMSWPPLDLGNLMRSQSPMTQVLMKNTVETNDLI